MQMRSRHLTGSPLVVLATAILLCGAMPRYTRGQEVSPKDNLQNRRTSVVTPEREAAAHKFVEQHHPALVELLTELKLSSSTEYGRAVFELFQTSERLARMQERDADRYRLELRLWKAKSRSELLFARLQMDDTPENRQQLRDALAQKGYLEIKILTLERDRMLEKASKIDQNIQQLIELKQVNIERRIKQATARRPARPANRLPRTVPAKKPTNTKPPSNKG